MLKINSHEYAKEHGWIPQNARGLQVFVSKFMLMLPPGSSDGSERNDEISIEHAGGESRESRNKKASLARASRNLFIKNDQ